MNHHRFRLSTILLLSGAAPIWIGLSVVLSHPSPGRPSGITIAPFVLIGITFAVHRLLRGKPNAWSWSALLAGVIALGSLTFARLLVGGWG